MTKRYVEGKGAVNAGWFVNEVMKTAKEPMTSYQVARKTGYTPQWCGKVLSKKWSYGYVAYKIVKYGRGEKRVWLDATIARETGEQGWVFAYDRSLL